MQLCAHCNKPQYRLRWVNGQGVGTDCGCIGRDHSGDSVHSPYEGLILKHALPNTEVPINSLRDITRFEQDHNVVHAVTSYGENYIPPDQKAPTFSTGVYTSLRDRGISVSDSYLRRRKG
jgi:hypothetical protein